MHPREAPPPPQTEETPAWSNWLSAALVVGGVALMLRTEVWSQGEWNARYGRKG